MQQVKIIQRVLVNGIRLDLEHLKNMPPIQKEFYKILDSEIEAKRSILRAKKPPYIIEGLLVPRTVDYYGDMHWADIFISNPDILDKVRERSKLTLTQIFEAIEALQPENWRAIFWMKQYLDLLEKHTELKIVYPMLIEKISKSQEEDYKKRVSETYRIRAVTGHSKSKKTKAKNEIKEKWLNWKKIYGEGRWRAKFARKMLEEYPILENQKSIENWAKEWEDELKK